MYIRFQHAKVKPWPKPKSNTRNTEENRGAGLTPPPFFIRRTGKSEPFRAQKRLKKAYSAVLTTGLIFALSASMLFFCTFMFSGWMVHEVADGRFDPKDFTYLSAGHSAGSLGDVSVRAASAMDKALDRADPVLLSAFEADGGIVLLCPQNAVEADRDSGQRVEVLESEQRSTVGYIGYVKDGDDYDALKIVIGDGITSIEKTLEHELGHYLDSKLGTPSENDPEFAMLFDVHASCLGLDQYFDEPGEFFAEVYALYRTDPEDLKRRCASAYHYMEKQEGLLQDIIRDY